MTNFVAYLVKRKKGKLPHQQKRAKQLEENAKKRQHKQKEILKVQQQSKKQTKKKEKMEINVHE